MPDPGRTRKESNPLAPRRVLVVDDSSFMLELIKGILQPEGYVIRTAGDGEEALAAIAVATFDLILTDVQMPRMTGLELVRALKANPRTRSIPVLMLTASIEDSVLVESLGMGVEDYVRKPFSPAEISARVAAVLSRARSNEVLRATFEQYVAPEVVQELLARDEGPVLTGEKKDIVVMFCDIRGFTSLAHDMEPQAVVSILNDVFTMITEVILDHRGMLDKFIGDGAMCLFGAPISYGNDAQRAVSAALDLQRRMTMYNAGGRAPVRLGIGIHRGLAVVGNVGSRQRLAYTAIGNCVNIAARLQGLAGPGETIISRDIVDALDRERFTCHELEAVTLKGLRERFPIFSVRELRRRTLPG